jgi:hypothetical protein
MSTNAGPNTRAGKPINVGDSITLIGAVTAVAANVGPTTVITVTLAGSGNTVSPQAQDCSASTQTL